VTLDDLQDKVEPEITVKTEAVDVKDSSDSNKDNVNIVVPAVEKKSSVPLKVPLLVSLLEDFLEVYQGFSQSEAY
jgi:hypothetical protein